MKKLKLLSRFLLSMVFVFISLGLFATNIQVSDIVIVERNDAEQYIIVQFDLSWDYSFRVDDGDNTNWDAAWVFMKFKDVNGPDNVSWDHATLSNAGHTIPGNYTSSLGSTGGVNKGIFIYPSVIFANTAEISGVQLRWDYGEDGLLPEDEVDIRAFGIEMVYVPTGSFYVGSGGGETSRFHAGGESDVTPFQVGSASFEIGNSIGNLWATGNRTAGSFAGNYPTGYNAFYMMKHNITQQAYVDFLNTLTYEQQDERVDGSPGDAVGTYTNNLNRHSIKIASQGSSGSDPAVYETDFPYLPVNFINPNDMLSYLDWAALRPYTELEYEKAARGPASPVPDEYAWGNTRAGQITSITDAGTATEAPVASGYQRDITIDHTKVSENLIDFPILVRLDNDNFDFTKCREDGFDFRFYDSNGDLLSYQRERHDFVAKKAEYWVKVPSISSSQNTIITLEYGNFSAIDGADPANVWEDNFVSVWHLDEDADATADEYNDSKGGNAGTGAGTVAANVEGHIGLAQEFAGAGLVSITDDATLDLEDYVTISGWVKPQELSGVSLTETSSADWDDYHSIDNLTTSVDKLAVASGPGVGYRISNAISLDAIKKVGTSFIDWEAQYGYKVVEFNSSGTFSVPAGVTEVDVLVVAGGGGGGGTIAGGGGAGGLVFESSYVVTPESNISVTVGDGGLGGFGYNASGGTQAGVQGGNSAFGSIVAIGGGGGGGWNDVDSSATGGSGGGDTNDRDGSEGTNLQGNAGGNSGGLDYGGGGGGAGAAGQNGAAGQGKGGDGLYYGDIFGDGYGDSGWFAGGGGGGSRESIAGTARHAGGQGGGGLGHYTHTEKAGNGMANTGGGGGGAGYAGTNPTERIGGDGGSGIVLLRYKDPQSVRVYTAINDDSGTPPAFDNMQVFTSDGTFTVPEGITEVEVLIVAGGGGGGGSAGAGASGAGGGAGGVVYAQNVQVTDPTYTIVVGAGGASSGVNSDTQGTNGENSSAFGLTALGGGGGGSRNPGDGTGKDGGSGGGVGSQVSGVQGAGLQPGSASGGFGSNGGDSGFIGGTGDDNASGGGGGAGATGGTGQDNVRSGNGGIGRYYGDIFGTSVGDDGWFAGGGGGGNPGGSRTVGLGGKGGGADGGSNDAANAMDNTGGGGGGAGANGNPSDGGSGIVIVRWGLATKGNPIPGITEDNDLTGKYLWVKQELITNNATHTPELESLELEIKGEAILAGKGEDAYQLSYYDENLRGYINNQRVSSALDLDEYQHLAITYNGSHQRMFINGLLTSTLGLTGNININADNLLLGTNLIGALDEFRLSSVARSQAWLKAEYHGGKGDLVQIGGEAQVNNAVFGNIDWGSGAGPLRVGFGASPTSSRTASGASYWGIMELSGNLWERVVSAGRPAGRTFTGLHGDGNLDASGLFNTANWTNELGNRGGAYLHGNTLFFRVSDRNSMGWNAAWLNRERWQGGRGVRTAP